MPRTMVHGLSFFLWASSLLVFGTLGGIYILLSFFIDAKTLHPFARAACWLGLLSGGQRLVVRGEFPALGESPRIYIFNHTSMLDTLILGAVIPHFFGAVGKAEQFDLPFWGTLIRRWGAIPLKRDHLEEAIESLNLASERLAEGGAILISPEGTRSRDGSLQPFKKGPFHLALQNQAEIIPLSIEGSFAAKRRGSWVLRPALIQVSPLPTIRITENETVDSLRHRAWQAFQTSPC